MEALGITRLQQYFRDLFIDELRADVGWSEYIDLLVRHLDLRGFSFLQSGGVPYVSSFGSFGSLMGVVGGSVVGSEDGSSSFCVVSEQADSYIFAFNAPRVGSSVLWFDYGDVRITSTVQEVSYVPTGVAYSLESVVTGWFHTASFYVPSHLEAEGSLDLGAAETFWDSETSTLRNLELLGKEYWLSEVDLFRYSGDQPCMLLVRVPKVVEVSYGNPLLVSGVLVDEVLSPQESGGRTVLTDFDLAGISVAGIPHVLNAAEVLHSRLVSGSGNSLYGVSAMQAGLFETMFGFPLDYSATPFRLMFESGVSLGDFSKVYPAYVEFRQVQLPLRGGAYWPLGSLSDSNEVLGLVSAESTIVNPLYDFWGSGDSVVSPSSMDSDLRALYRKYGSSILGYDKKLWVVVSNGVNDGSITKDYRTLTMQPGVLGRVLVSFSCYKSDFIKMLQSVGLVSGDGDVESMVDAYIAWMESVLGRSVPLGVDVRIVFNPPALFGGVDVSGVSTLTSDSSLYMLVDPTGYSVDGEDVDLYRAVLVRSTVGWGVRVVMDPFFVISDDGVTWSEGSELMDGDGNIKRVYRYRSSSEVSDVDPGVVEEINI